MVVYLIIFAPIKCPNYPILLVAQQMKGIQLLFANLFELIYLGKFLFDMHVDIWVFWSRLG